MIFISGYYQQSWFILTSNIMTAIYNMGGEHVFANSIEFLAYVKQIVPVDVYRKVKKSPPFPKSKKPIILSNKLLKNILSQYCDELEPDCITRPITEKKNPIKFGINKIFPYLCSIKIKQLWNARFSS